MGTIDVIKQQRSVSEEIKRKIKEIATIKKNILNSLKTGDKTVLQIANETNIPSDIVMFHLMTLRKYGEIETGELDDMDEYYSYKLKKQK